MEFARPSFSMIRQHIYPLYKAACVQLSFSRHDSSLQITCRQCNMASIQFKTLMNGPLRMSDSKNITAAKFNPLSRNVFLILFTNIDLILSRNHSSIVPYIIISNLLIQRSIWRSIVFVYVLDCVLTAEAISHFAASNIDTDYLQTQNRFGFKMSEIERRLE